MLNPMDSLTEQEKDGLLPIFLLYSPTACSYINISTSLDPTNTTDLIITQVPTFNCASIYSSRKVLEEVLKYIHINFTSQNHVLKGFYIQTFYTFIPYISSKEEDTAFYLKKENKVDPNSVLLDATTTTPST